MDDAPRRILSAVALPVIDPDGPLIARLQAGDERAFAELLNRHLRPVAGFAYRMLGDSSEAEDIAQETFLRLWRHRYSWKPQAKLRTWLYRVARNLCIDRHRRREIVTGRIPEREDPGPGPTGYRQRSEVARIVSAALGSLPERQQAAVMLVYHEGLSNIDAASALGVTIDALESLHRARAPGAAPPVDKPAPLPFGRLAMDRSDQSNGVTRRRAQRVLEAYGGDPANWPAEECAAMLSALERSHELRIRREAGAALDRALAPKSTPEFSSSLVARIRLAARGERGPSPAQRVLSAAASRISEWRRLLQPAAALTFAVVLGIVAGAAMSPPRPAQVDVAAQFLQLAFGHAYQVAENELVESYE